MLTNGLQMSITRFPVPAGLHSAVLSINPTNFLYGLLEIFGKVESLWEHELYLVTERCRITLSHASLYTWPSLSRLTNTYPAVFFMGDWKHLWGLEAFGNTSFTWTQNDAEWLSHWPSRFHLTHKYPTNFLLGPWKYLWWLEASDNTSFL